MIKLRYPQCCKWLYYFSVITIRISANTAYLLCLVDQFPFMKANSSECNICNKTCGSRPAVKCSSCLKWQHTRCTKLTTMQISLYLNSNTSYICSKCLIDILPFQQVCDVEFKEMFYQNIFKQITSTLNNEPNLDDLIKPNRLVKLLGGAILATAVAGSKQSLHYRSYQCSNKSVGSRDLLCHCFCIMLMNQNRLIEGKIIINPIMLKRFYILLDL